MEPNSGAITIIRHPTCHWKSLKHHKQFLTPAGIMLLISISKFRQLTEKHERNVIISKEIFYHVN